MTIRPNSWLVPFALAVIIAAYLIILFYRGFNDPDEGRYSEIPREMVASGNWMEMRMLGFRYYEKPPLAYWLVAPAIKIFGAHDWSARIPLLFSGLIGFFILAVAAVRKFGARHGLSSVVVMASMVGFIAGNGLLMTDSFLMVLFSATCLCFYSAFENNVAPRDHLQFLMLGVVLAVLGFLTKGAVAIVLPAGIVFLWLLWEKRLALLRPSSIGLAVLFGALLILPVLWLIERHNPGFTRHFIYEEHIARFQGTRATQLHPEPFWFFLLVLPLLLLPWTLFLFRAVRNIWRQKAFAHDSFSRFLFVWAAVVICFFSASTGKLMSYILPALPPLGLLIGRWGLSEEKADGSKWDKWLWNTGVAGFVIVTLTVVVAWNLSYFHFRPEKIYPITGLSVIALLPAGAALLYFILSKSGNVFGKLLLFNSGIMLTAALLLSPLAGKDFNVLAHINSSYVYKSLARHLQPEDRIIVFWSYRPALPFYTQRFYTPYEEENELFYGMKMEPALPGDLNSAADVRKFCAQSSGRVFAIVEPQDLKKKFLPLNLSYRATSLPRDPDTIIYELIRPENN
ncbi:MAG: glycosyltransferase family 39 protein [Kiritimatiellae bacterium]|nr:glycosyltransferase family 39 protein [Kiritimatiellia bacterium]